MFKKKISRYLPVIFFLIALILSASVQAVYVRLNESVEFPITEAETFVKLFDNSTVGNGGGGIATESDPIFTSNLTLGFTENITTTGNVSANYYFGNGSRLESLPSGAAPYLKSTQIGFGDTNDALVSDAQFTYNNNTQTLSVENLTVSQGLAVGSLAYLRQNSPIWIFEEFTTQGDFRGLTSTVRSTFANQAPDYFYSLAFESIADHDAGIFYRLVGILGFAKNTGTGDVDGSRGGQFYVKNYDTGTITSAQGIQGGLINVGEGSITGSNFETTTTVSAGSIPTWKGLSILNPDVSGTGSIPLGYGIHIQDLSDVDTAWGIYQVGTNPNLLGGNLTAKNISADYIFAESFYQTGSKANYFNGLVGIGTNAPDSILHIKANTPGTVGSHAAGQLIIQDPDDTVFGNVVITAYESDGAGNPDQQLWYLGSSSGSNTDITFLNRRNSKLQLGTAGVAKMTILGDGKVGIGTTSPTHKLNVVGDLNVTGNITSNFYFGNGSQLTSVHGDGNATEWVKAQNYLIVESDPLFGSNLTNGFSAIVKPYTDALYDFGTSSRQWLTGHFSKLSVSDYINVSGNLQGGVTHAITYHPLAFSVDSSLPSREWKTESVYTISQPDVPRSIIFTVSPALDTTTGSINITCMDADGRNVSEVLAVSCASVATYNTSIACAKIWNITITDTGGIVANYEVGRRDVIGFTNFPWRSESNVLKLTINTVDKDQRLYTVNKTYGTIDISPSAIGISGDIWTAWIRPFK